jgi:hypothetical protein
MIIIPVDEMAWPQDTAIKIVCDGKNYTVYEDGDELPPEPTNE